MEDSRRVTPTSEVGPLTCPGFLKSALLSNDAGSSDEALEATNVTPLRTPNSDRISQRMPVLIHSMADPWSLLIWRIRYRMAILRSSASQVEREKW